MKTHAALYVHVLAIELMFPGCSPKLPTPNIAANGLAVFTKTSVQNVCVADSLFAANANPWRSTISTVNTSASGEVSPTSSFGDYVGVSDPDAAYTYAAIDFANNFIAISELNTNSVALFARNPTAIGVQNIRPVGIISGANTLLNTPFGTAFYQGELFVMNQGNGTITVFNETDTGNIAPKRLLDGASVPLKNNSQRISMSGTGTMFIGAALNGAIYGWPTTASGNTAPSYTSTNVYNPIGVTYAGGEVYLTMYAIYTTLADGAKLIPPQVQPSIIVPWLIRAPCTILILWFMTVLPHKCPRSQPLVVQPYPEQEAYKSSTFLQSQSELLTPFLLSPNTLAYTAG